MFDFAWSEIALIGIVALVAIGPKDLPVAIKAVAEMVKKARRMAGEFQTHVDEMVREANLSEVRDQFNDLRRMDIKGKILDAVDGDQTLRNTIKDNPLKDAFTTPSSSATLPGDIDPAPPPVPVADHVSALTAEAVGERPEHAIPPPEAPVEAGPPSFLPPKVVAAGLPSSRALPPAFVPPAVVAQSTRRREYASPYA